MTGHVLSVAAGATGQRSPSAPGPVEEVFNIDQELAPTQRKNCNILLIPVFIRCSEKCARRDWSERVHYISIKHAPYVTRVHCRNIMHAAYVISISARNSRYIL